MSSSMDLVCDVPGEALGGILRRDGLLSVFQPILDLRSRSVWGYEILSRGDVPLESAQALFAAARESGRLGDVEIACLRKALQTVAEGPFLLLNRFFLNVSPPVLLSPEFAHAFNGEVVAAFGLSPERLVVEITERESIADLDLFGHVVDRLRRQGFRIALDDMGAGHSGLRTLMACLPDYIKLDMSLVRKIQDEPNCQHLVRFLLDFAAQIGSRIIAEGVESWEEFDVLARLGVPLVQGFLFGPPQREPLSPSPSVMERVGRSCPDERRRGPFSSRPEGVARLAIRGKVVEKGLSRGRDVDALFRRECRLDHLVVLDGEEPCGLITRQSFFQKMGGAFGYHLYREQAAETLSKRDFLVVPGDMSVCTVAKSAMERDPESLYDPVLVVEEGRFVGSVTMKQIISHSVRFEVDEARNCNPLSGLPGNRNVEEWIEEARRRGSPFTVVYADLDRFKEFNDRYGFLQGDRLLRLTADLLQEGLEGLPSGTKIGHVGGDDFVLVAPGEVSLEALESLCRSFDDRKGIFFSEEERRRGSYEAKNRSGERGPVPLVTLSLAAVESDRSDGAGGLAERAAALKEEAKVISARERVSSVTAERREDR
ncbi:EAL and GGDEF domain-containing protein [Aminithiophilus ramosus]|uniref:EAL and GGDEF domain-containing protein n=2 Tax=Synergistales TaxID=649776 RepID=A0A9Q7ANQ0_9BACT|nr:bifunctional diguanylate cyclase/phosphodiesterase [Aminithiophilus ramosus]QTX32797.1 EAL and GGDEF domain-containing protein [Aminithiophilus ramosus]QVL36672.1 EAL and GGDEF domain-containing protein [Synergistota bacterium]